MPRRDDFPYRRVHRAPVWWWFAAGLLLIIVMSWWIGHFPSAPEEPAPPISEAAPDESRAFVPHALGAADTTALRMATRRNADALRAREEGRRGEAAEALVAASEAHPISDWSLVLAAEARGATGDESG